MAYFLISVSNKTNLELCIKYALAGFTNSINGLWTFSELQEGDFISFIYGAKVFNLYTIERKEAIRNAEKIGPWPPVTFTMSRNTYYFPFRVFLKPLREFTESMIKPEFSYVAENLLLRGGYRRTHFQADRVTFHAVSQMGELYGTPIDEFKSNYKKFTPRFTLDKKDLNVPYVFYLHEIIIQSAIRQYLSKEKNLRFFFELTNLGNLSPEDFEVLGEKAFPEGHVDILIKEHSPKGYCRKIIVEIKKEALRNKDIDQLIMYTNELGKECECGVLIGKEVSNKVLKKAKNHRIECLIYTHRNFKRPFSFNELLTSLSFLKP
ncbi:MAG: hypothetical protein ABIK10_01775 [candidate division WOR-3 bacterium]